MASAALKMEPEAGVEIPGEGDHGDDGSQTGERDYDAEARSRGWAPEEEFKGDKARWVDAKTFVERTDTMMPLLKADRDRLKRELADIKKDLRRATTHFEGAEKRAYEKAKADLQADIEAAIETGDVEAGKAALKKIDELKPAGESETGPKHTKEEAQEALDSFREEHPWYDKANLANASEVEINARLFFDRMIDKNIAKTEEMAPADFFAFIADMTLDKYPALKGKPPRVKPNSAVEAGGRGGGGRGQVKTWDNLPDAAKNQFTRFINRGLTGIKSTGDAEKDAAAARAYYARTFDWEGYVQ
jgi:hypothetical protein